MKFHSELLNYIDIEVMDIHGKQKQQKRTTTFFQFCKADKVGTYLSFICMTSDNKQNWKYSRCRSINIFVKLNFYLFRGCHCNPMLILCKRYSCQRHIVVDLLYHTIRIVLSNLIILHTHTHTHHVHLGHSSVH